MASVGSFKKYPPFFSGFKLIPLKSKEGEFLMEAMEAILSRRSIRHYRSGKIPEEVVGELLMAAMSAPSASNEQPWHFIVIDDRRILDEVPKYHPYSNMLREASLAIAVCGDLERQTRDGYWVQDCSAATENILIAAHALGLGAVWLGVYPREDRVQATKELLGIPEHVLPLCLIAVGYPAEQKPRSDRYQESRIHHNRW
jgi:nitroreductase